MVPDGSVFRMLSTQMLSFASLVSRVWKGVVCALILTSLVCEAASAAGTFWPGGRRSKKNWSVGIQLGARYFTHYNRETVLSTPPEMLLGEFYFTVRHNKSLISFNLIGSTSISKGKGSMFGAGFKLPFLTLGAQRNKSVIGAISLQLAADLLFYSIAAPTPPRTYSTSGVNFRYGGTILWFFGSGRFYLDTTMMVTRFNDNFFIGPYMGIGFSF